MADEPKIESQDNTSELDILKKRIDDVEMAMGAFNPRNLAGLRTKDLQQATRSNLFGNGSDGDVVVSTEINLTRDMFYNNLTVEDGGIINTKSFRIFTKNQFIKKPGGIVRNNGNNGVAGANGVGGTGDGNSGGAGGAAVVSGSLIGSVAGSAGGHGYQPYGGGPEAGVAGIAAAKSLGSAGSGGGGGGTDGLAGAGAGGAGGSQTGTLFNITNSFLSAYYLIDILPSVIALTLSAGSGGGGGGGSNDGASNGGGGGGAGSPGGMIWIAANRMFIEGSDEIQCNAGNGANGGNGFVETGNSGGGGGGGAGGSGGVIMLIFGDKTGTGTSKVAGGTAGAGGTGSGGGNNGAAGAAGQTGQTYNIIIQ